MNNHAYLMNLTTQIFEQVSLEHWFLRMVEKEEGYNDYKQQ